MKEHKHKGLGNVGERGKIGKAGTWACPASCTANAPDGTNDPSDEPDAGDEKTDDGDGADVGDDGEGKNAGDEDDS